jgi:hypothetical protein
MFWFKHFTASHEDPDISDAWDKFGDAGPLIFWIILEVYGQEFSHLENDFLSISLRYFERKTRRKFKKSEKILEFFKNRSRIYFKIEGENILIKCPKFIDIASNWTKRENKSPTEAPTEVPTAKEVEVEVEVEKKPPIVPHDFDLFWKSYPKKIGKVAALKSWKKNNHPSVEKIITAIEIQKSSEQWKKDGGQFIPHPATWLNQGRWDDETAQTEDPIEIEYKGKYGHLPGQLA